MSISTIDLQHLTQRGGCRDAINRVSTGQIRILIHPALPDLLHTKIVQGECKNK